MFVHEAGMKDNIQTKLTDICVNKIWEDKVSELNNSLFSEIQIKDLEGGMPR